MSWFRLVVFLFVSLFAVSVVGAAGCGDKYARRGCQRYCKCHKGKSSLEACAKRCRKKLAALFDTDSARARQIRDCIGSDTVPTCRELKICAATLLE